MSILTAEELKKIVEENATDKCSLQETAEGWLYWFEKRASKRLKDAAKCGYTEIEMEMPMEIAISFDTKVLSFIRKSLRELLDGCFVGFVEDEYNEKPIIKVLISWK